MSGEKKPDKGRLWAQAMERDRVKRKRDGAAEGRAVTWGEERGPMRCAHCETLIVPQAGWQCRVLVVVRQSMDVDGDGRLTNPGPSQTLVYHGPCGVVVDRAAFEFRTG
jgi:hypothetical protein